MIQLLAAGVIVKGAKNFWLELYRDECDHCRGTGKVVCKHCHGTKDLRRGVGVLDHAKLQITENPAMQYDLSLPLQALACIKLSRSLEVVRILHWSTCEQLLEWKPLYIWKPCMWFGPAACIAETAATRQAALAGRLLDEAWPIQLHCI